MKTRESNATTPGREPAASTRRMSLGTSAAVQGDATTPSAAGQTDISQSPRMTAQRRAMDGLLGTPTNATVAQRQLAAAGSGVIQLAKRVRNVITAVERDVDDDYVLQDNELFVGQHGPVPRGFGDEQQFRDLTRPYAQQDRSGSLIVSGSSVTNRSYRSGQPFRAESDIDVGLVSSDWSRLNQVQPNGFPVPRTPLSQVERQTTQQAQQTIHRPMGLRVYNRAPNRTYIERPHTPEPDREVDRDGREVPALPQPRPRVHPGRGGRYPPPPRRDSPPYRRRDRSRDRYQRRDRSRDREDDRDRERNRYGRDRYRDRSPDRRESRRSRSRERSRDDSRDRSRDRRRERSPSPDPRDPRRARRRSPSRSPSPPRRERSRSRSRDRRHNRKRSRSRSRS